MKKYLLLIALSFLISAPVFALDSNTEFSISFCLTAETSAIRLVNYSYTGETDEASFSLGIADDGGDIFSYFFIEDTTATNDEIRGDIINAGETGAIILNYSDGVSSFYANGELQGITNININNLTFERGELPPTTTNFTEFNTLRTVDYINTFTCAGAPETLTATGTLEQLGGVVLSTSFYSIVEIFKNYFPYALIFLIVGGIAGLIARFFNSALRTKK